MSQNNLPNTTNEGFFSRLATLLSPADEMRVKTREIQTRNTATKTARLDEHRLHIERRKHALPPFPKLL